MATKRGTPDQDRRRHSRFPIDDYSVVLYRIGLLERIIFRKRNIGRAIEDLSESGVCVVLEKRVRLGTPVHLLLILNKFSDMFEARGKVRWVRASRKKDHFDAGVEFTGIGKVHSRKMQHIKGWFTSKAFQRQMTTRRTKEGKGFQFPR